MTLEKTVETILEETDLEKEDLKEKVDDKMEEFSGLVSEEGALHLVAKEEGVDLAQETDKELKIKNIVPEMRNVNIKARVTNILDINTFTRDDGDEGKVQNIVLGDDTGSIRVTLWDEQTEIADKIEEGDPIHIQSAYTVEDDRENAEIRLGDSSQVKMADEDEVPEVESGSTETQEASIREVNSENTSYKINGIIVTFYTSNPFYMVDPESGESVQEDEDGNYVTKDGEEVEDPGYRLAVSAVIDDGTGNIRTVFFRDLARKVLGIDEEVEAEGDKKAVEKAAEEVIGDEIELDGGTRYNDYFGTLEIIANEVKSIDAKQQLENLLETMEA